MEFFEKDLEQIIYETSNDELLDRGLYISGKKIRQLKIGGYGISDIVCIEKRYHYDDDMWSDTMGKRIPYLYINVMELKLKKAGISAFLQAIRYAKGIKDYLDRRNFYNYKLQITLVANKIDCDSDYIFITDLVKSDCMRCISSVINYSFSYDFNGIKFKQERSYCLTNNGFKL